MYRPASELLSVQPSVTVAIAGTMLSCLKPATKRGKLPQGNFLSAKHRSDCEVRTHDHCHHKGVARNLLTTEKLQSKNNLFLSLKIISLLAKILFTCSSVNIVGSIMNRPRKFYFVVLCGVVYRLLELGFRLACCKKEMKQCRCLAEATIKAGFNVFKFLVLGFTYWFSEGES